jgi:hypothetical protein
MLQRTSMQRKMARHVKLKICRVPQHGSLSEANPPEIRCVSARQLQTQAQDWSFIGIGRSALVGLECQAIGKRHPAHRSAAPLTLRIRPARPQTCAFGPRGTMVASPSVSLLSSGPRRARQSGQWCGHPTVSDLCYWIANVWDWLELVCSRRGRDYIRAWLGPKRVDFVYPRLRRVSS